MLRNFTTFLCTSAAVVLAQQPPVAGDFPQHGVEATDRNGALATAQSQLHEPQGVLIDAQTSGPIQVRGDNYKASFDSAGWTFYPRQPLAQEQQSLRSVLREVYLCGQLLPLKKMAPVVGDQQVAWQRGSLVEQVALREGQVEHSFRFDQLSQRGEIDLTIATATALTGVPDAGGIRFQGAAGDVAYSQAIAIDAAGHRLLLSTTLRQGTVWITVPKEFVQAAVLPLTVDPIVTSSVVTSSTGLLLRPDIAYDVTRDQYLVVWETQWTPTDHDVYCQRFDRLMAPVGPAVVLDASTNDWRQPKVAFSRIGDCFLTVVEALVPPSVSTVVVGRMLGAGGGPLQAPITIHAPAPGAPYATSYKTPDVGGDLFDGPSQSYFAVVSQVVPSFSLTLTDVYCSLVDAQTSWQLRWQAIDARPGYAANPRISKTNNGDGRWLIVWEAGPTPTASPTQPWSVSGALLTWDGNVVPVSGSGHFGISTGGLNQVTPAASSPIRVQGSTTRYYLCAFRRDNPSPTVQGDLMGAVVSETGQVMLIADLQQIEGGGSYTTWPQERPSVDSDGSRFAVAYQERYQGTLDWDTRVSTFAFLRGSNSLVCHDVRRPVYALGTPVTLDHMQPQLAAAHGRSPDTTMEFGIANLHHDVLGVRSIHAFRYRGFAAGGYASPLGYGCGGLGITASNAPALGHGIGLALSASGLLTGFLIGYPANLTLPGCLSCPIGVSSGVVMANPATITIPNNGTLVGMTLAVQGFSIGGGPCLGSVSVSGLITIQVQ